MLAARRADDFTKQRAPFACRSQRRLYTSPITRPPPDIALASKHRPQRRIYVVRR